MLVVVCVFFQESPPSSQIKILGTGLDLTHTEAVVGKVLSGVRVGALYLLGNSGRFAS